MALVNYGAADAVKAEAAKLSQEINKVLTTPPPIPADSEQGKKLTAHIVRLADFPTLVDQIASSASVLNPSSQMIALGMLKALQDELTAMRSDVKVTDSAWASQTGRSLVAVDRSWVDTLLSLAKWVVIGAGVYYGGKLLLRWNEERGNRRYLED